MSKNSKWNVDNFYVIHAAHGYEAREKMLSKLFLDYKLDVAFVTEASDKNINEAWINQYFVQGATNQFSNAEIFCALGHILIYQRMVQTNQPYAVIFEDDVCFLSSFNSKMPLVAQEAKQLSPGFIVSLENSTLKFPSRKAVEKGKYIYEASIARCTGAYLIDLKAASSILEYLKINKCNQVIDWWHNELIKKNIFKMYWAHPPLTEQGSFNGKFSSTISRRSSGIFRRLQWEFQKFYKMHVLWWFR